MWCQVAPHTTMFGNDARRRTTLHCAVSHTILPVVACSNCSFCGPKRAGSEIADSFRGIAWGCCGPRWETLCTCTF